MRTIKDLTLDEFNLFMDGFIQGMNYGQAQYNTELEDMEKTKRAREVYNEIYQRVREEIG